MALKRIKTFSLSWLKFLGKLLNVCFFCLLSQSPTTLCEQKGCNALLLGFWRLQDFSGLPLNIFLVRPGSCSDARQVSRQKKENSIWRKRCCCSVGMSQVWANSRRTGSISISLLQESCPHSERQPSSWDICLTGKQKRLLSQCWE